MNQNLWGSSLWYSLHTMTLVYPLRPSNDDKKNYKNFFMNLQHVIPCSVCKNNYKRHILEHPIDNFLENRKTLFNWVVDIHNMVNGETGKKILSYSVVLKKYEDVYKKQIDLLSENDINYDDDKDTWEMRKKKFDQNSAGPRRACSDADQLESVATKKRMIPKGFDNSNSCSINLNSDSINSTEDSNATHSTNNNEQAINLNGTKILTDNPENYQNKSIDNSYNFYFLYFLITILIILLFLNLVYKKIGGKK
jgi:hypothetical protein